MWSTVFCLASGLDTCPSHLLHQGDSTYSPGTSKLLCQNFSSGKEEKSMWMKLNSVGHAFWLWKNSLVRNDNFMEN